MFMKKIMKMIIIKKMFLFNMFIEIAFISAFVITAGATIFEFVMYIIQICTTHTFKSIDKTLFLSHGT